MSEAAARGAFTVWRVLMGAQLREQPVRLIVTVIAIALGVALGASVYLVNAAALNEFGLATKKLVGEADVIVRGPGGGFSQTLYTDLSRNPRVGVASPVLELDVALPARHETLKLLGIDMFTASALQPAIIGDIGDGIFDLLKGGVYLSSTAARQLGLRRGDVLQVIVGSATRPLPVLGVLSRATYGQALAIMDIAAAQWTFQALGKLNRIDVRLNPGVDVDAFRNDLKRTLPPGVLAIAPQVERDRAVTVTRAYRVNLNMLALVALWTGAFLVFATQSLSVLRRRRSLALLRALGVTRGQLQGALVGEGAALGAVGSLLGVCFGALIAAVMLRWLSGDLGNGQLRAVTASLTAAPLPVLAFLVIGIGVASLGAWLPARNAARQAPAQALKGTVGDYTVAAGRSAYTGLALLVVGAGLAQLPAMAGLPIFGYAAIAALLFGAVLLVPSLTVTILNVAPRTRRVVLDTAVAQLKDNVGLSTLSLASIIVSFSLMVAMAIMVFSFRVSFEHWLGKLLPADLQLREPLGNDTAFWSPATQATLSALDGVARADFRRTTQVLLDAARPPVTVIARGSSARDITAALPLVSDAAARRDGAPAAAESATETSARALAPAEPAWISEPLRDVYGYRPGDEILLPLAGQERRFTVAGVWRDYARAAGAVVIPRGSYVRMTGDGSANEASIWLTGRRDAASVEAAIRAALGRDDPLDIMTSTALRDKSLQIFDRAFAITYALEAVAVIIGLTGVSFAASSTALARRGEFGMLRHIGMLRRQVVGMLASEGTVMSVFGVAYGLLLGGALSLVLVYVVNRQSFNWSIDLAVPAWQLALLSVILIAAAALTAIWSGRAATNLEAVRAVREDA